MLIVEDSAEVSVAEGLLARSDELQMELIEAAKHLFNECHALIRELDEERQYRKPPATLTCKSRSGVFGPRVVWVTYTAGRKPGRDGALVRFTHELCGRKNRRYPKTVLAGYSPSLREQLWAPEGRAVLLGEHIAFWRSTLAAARLMAGGRILCSAGCWMACALRADPRASRPSQRFQWGQTRCCAGRSRARALSRRFQSYC